MTGSPLRDGLVALALVQGMPQIHIAEPEHPHLGQLDRRDAAALRVHHGQYLTGLRQWLPRPLVLQHQASVVVFAPDKIAPARRSRSGPGNRELRHRKIAEIHAVEPTVLWPWGRGPPRAAILWGVSGEIRGHPVNAVLIPPQAERFASLVGADLSRLALNVTGWNKLVLLDTDRVFLFPRSADGVEWFERELAAYRALAKTQLTIVPRLLGRWENPEIYPFPFAAVTRLQWRGSRRARGPDRAAGPGHRQLA